MIILGIDPGSNCTGYGIIEVNGSAEHARAQGVIRLSSDTAHVDRLKQIYDGVAELIDAHTPEVLAIEMPVYGKNPQSMLKLGRAQAAAMMAGLNHDLDVVQYTPKEVKKSVTGNGNASKQQVRYMIHAILEMNGAAADISLDASDALAIALCHTNRRSHGATEQYSGWGSFVDANPDRVQ
ncbi:MAG: crossover junction endodeoxyribonuclease RuvC [Longimonas sp.]|uniref:crossover junction endodeoxyribonuclease RuvC n=1 Tax=Longimonas sp. TaxID=2039626 RepID=UPI003354CF08